jgi:hypothetical protein
LESELLSVSLNETQQFCTKSEGLICKDFGCSNVMRKMGRLMIFGYAQVSTDGQTLNAQHAALVALAQWCLRALCDHLAVSAMCRR